MLVSQLLQNSFFWCHLFPFYQVNAEASDTLLFLWSPIKDKQQRCLTSWTVLCTQPWYLTVEETLVYQSNLPPGCFCLGKQAPGRAQDTGNKNTTESCGEQVPGQCVEGKRSYVPAKLHFTAMDLALLLNRRTSTCRTDPSEKRRWFCQHCEYERGSTFQIKPLLSTRAASLITQQYWGHSFEAEVHCRLQ